MKPAARAAVSAASLGDTATIWLLRMGAPAGSASSVVRLFASKVRICVSRRAACAVLLSCEFAVSITAPRGAVTAATAGATGKAGSVGTASCAAAATVAPMAAVAARATPAMCLRADFFICMVMITSQPPDPSVSVNQLWKKTRGCVV